MTADHPEALLDRARAGQITAAELLELERHVARCAVCRFELRLSEDAQRAGKPRGSDELSIARIRRATTRRLVARGLAARAPAVKRRRRVAWLLAAALLAVAIATSAALKPRAEPPARLRQGAEPVRRLALAWTGRVLARADAPALQPAAAGPERAPASRRPVARAEPVLPPASAAELFSEANRARRAGNVSEAASRYRQLQAAFPGSTEAQVSRVSLGRVFLDRSGSPAAALKEFDGYLAGGHGALRHEALIGRALSLQRMGRKSEELSAWRAVLAAHPKTSHATHARARIQELTQHAGQRVSPR